MVTDVRCSSLLHYEWSLVVKNMYIIWGASHKRSIYRGALIQKSLRTPALLYGSTALVFFTDNVSKTTTLNFKCSKLQCQCPYPFPAFQRPQTSLWRSARRWVLQKQPRPFLQSSLQQDGGRDRDDYPSTSTNLTWVSGFLLGMLDPH